MLMEKEDVIATLQSEIFKLNQDKNEAKIALSSSLIRNHDLEQQVLGGTTKLAAANNSLKEAEERLNAASGLEKHIKTTLGVELVALKDQLKVAHSKITKTQKDKDLFSRRLKNYRDQRATFQACESSLFAVITSLPTKNARLDGEYSRGLDRTKQQQRASGAFVSRKKQKLSESNECSIKPSTIYALTKL